MRCSGRLEECGATSQEEYIAGDCSSCRPRVAPPVDGQRLTASMLESMIAEQIRQSRVEQSSAKFLQSQSISPLEALGSKIYDTVKAIAIRGDEEAWLRGGSITCPHLLLVPVVGDDCYMVELLGWRLYLCEGCHRGIDAFRKVRGW